MIIKIKKVYYCEFCKKHSLVPIGEHEKHCTGNINRTCRMCADETGGIDLSKTVEKWKKIAETAKKIPKKERDSFGCSTVTGAEYEEIEKLVNSKLTMQDAEGCPACSLAIVRLAGLNEYPLFTEFDFKDEKKKWWDKVNDEKNASEVW